MASLPFLKILFVLLIGNVDCSHFRGGIIDWRPTDPNPPAGELPMVQFAWRVSFARGSPGGTHYCDEALIDSQTLKTGEGTLTCDNGCTQLNETFSYVCTGFSADEQWTTGVGGVGYSPSTATFDALYSGNAWTRLENGAGNWILRTKVDLTRRPDNGLINSSPKTSYLPIVRFQRNCSSRLMIPVSDIDGDVVKCRLADTLKDECSGICGGLDGTETFDQENCILEWTPLTVGNYGFAVQIEDFISKNDSTPLSSIPLQFLIDVFEGNSPCGAKPEFVPPTPPQNSCIPIPSGETASVRIVAAVSDSSRSIVSISTVSPIGLSTTAVQPLPDSNLEYFIDATWTPPNSTSTEETFCYLAKDNGGLASEQQCVTFVTGALPPQVVQVESVSEDELKIIFDQPVERPALGPANVSISSAVSQRVIYTGSTLSSDFEFNNTETVLLTVPSGTTQKGFSYIMSFGDGVVATTASCGIPSTHQDITFRIAGNDKILCPSDIITTATGNDIYATVTWQTPVLPDGVEVKQVAGPSSSSVTYPIGTRDTIRYVFITPNNTAYVCEFMVIVGPDPHPCPEKVEVVVLVGNGGASVFWTEPSSREKVLNKPPLPGSFFEIGIHPVCYHYITITNDTDSCTFDVIVREETPCCDNVCGHYGECLPMNVTDFVCVCNGCYYGERCEKEAHVCNQTQCNNGGSCQLFEGSCEKFYCDCPPCFFGQYCENSVDACSNNDCRNGAACLPYGNSCEQYICECQNCTYGKYCENEFPDPCTSEPCSHGSSCVKLPETCHSYICVADDDTAQNGCQDGEFSIVKDPCNSFPCKNGGSCIFDNVEYTCLCREGFGGTNCQQTAGDFVDRCENNTCQNGAECFNSFTPSNYSTASGQYTCSCLTGFVGIDCAFTAATGPGVDSCNVNNVNCYHNETCGNTYSSTGSESFICNCAVGYIGQLCDVESVDPCSSNPCQNGASCISHNTYFACDCVEGLGGPTCEILKNNSSAPLIENCPGPIIIQSTVPTVVPWDWPKVTDITGYPVPLIDANSAPDVIHEPDSSLKVELVYENLNGIKATCSFVIVVSGDGYQTNTG